MAVAASGYMAFIIDFSGLVAARRQAYSGANRSGRLEVARIFKAVANEVAVMAPMPGIDMSMRHAWL